MKTINKVLETMLSKPATPTWTVSEPSPIHAQAARFEGPTQQWIWGG